jgi:hypothetical protein
MYIHLYILHDININLKIMILTNLLYFNQVKRDVLERGREVPGILY